MIRSVPWDLLYVCAELMTGKSIPLLVAIATLPVGQALAWLMVALGAVAGTLFSVYATHRGGGGSLSLLSSANRALQLCFSLGLSLSLLVSLANGIHAHSGASLAVIPAFCLVAHSLPQRHSTALVSLVLCLLVFYACILAEAASPGGPQQPVDQPTPGYLSLGEVISRALQLFTLAFYACIQHAPTQVYFDLGGSCGPVYASHHHARHPPYCLFISLVAGWLRVCLWSGICFMRDSQLHAMLEGQLGSSRSWPCILLYMTALLYSACWAATQLREQVLPRFGLESGLDRIKVLVCVTALAVYHRQRSGPSMFYVADAMAGASILSALAHIYQIHGPHHESDHHHHINNSNNRFDGKYHREKKGTFPCVQTSPAETNPFRMQSPRVFKQRGELTGLTLLVSLFSSITTIIITVSL